MEILFDLLEQRPTKFLRPLLCASLEKSCPSWVPYQNAPQSSGQAPGQMVGNVSSAGQKYTPSGHVFQHPGTSRSVLTPNAGPTQPTLVIPSVGQTLPQLISQTSKQLWIFFGVQGPRITLEVDQIGGNDLQSDTLFLRQLRRRHFQLRGRLRSYFSFWRLSYWEFVKVRSTKPCQTLQLILSVRENTAAARSGCCPKG